MCFDITTINTRESIRVRGLHLVYVLHPVRLPLPSFQVVHFVISFLFQLTLTSGSFTSSFRFEPFISFYFFPSDSIVLHPLRLPPFPFRVSISSRPSFRCNATLRFVTSFLSFQLFRTRFVTSFPFVSTLRFCSLYFISRSFRFKLFPSLRYFLPIVSTLPSCSFTSSFHFTAFISLLPFILVQRFHPVRLPLPFVSSRSLRYNLSLQLFFPVRLALPCLPFLSTRPFHCVRLFVATLPCYSCGIRSLRNSSSGGKKSSSGNLSSQFVFGRGIRLRDAIRLRGKFVFGIRFRGESVFGAKFVFGKFVFAIRRPGGN